MSKSRQEKSRTPAQQNAAPPPSNDIIPGRFTENDWHRMVAQEDGEEFVVDVVNDIVQATLDVIYKKYIKQQTLPYTVDAAREMILQIVEWQFLACDHGEENPGGDMTWLEEEEPLAPVTDSWAQGSVPVATQRPISSDSICSESSGIDSEFPSSMESRPGAPEPPYEKLDAPYTPATIVSPQEPLTTDKDLPEQMEQIDEVLSEKTDKKKQTRTETKRAPFRPRKGKLPCFSGVDLTSLTDDYVIKKHQRKPQSPEAVLDHHGLTMLSSSSSILKMSDFQHYSNRESDELEQMTSCNYGTSLSHSQCGKVMAQQGRPPGRKDVVYDDKGNVVAVMKISPDKLPTHRVRTKYTIVDSEAELTAKMRSKKKKVPHVTASQKNRHEVAETATVVSFASTKYTAPRQESNKGVTPLPPPLVDSMDINAGVVVREGGLIRRGPQQVYRQVEKTPSTVTLRPLDNTTRQTVTAKDFLHSVSSPVVKPFANSDPVPPILHQTRTVELIN